MKVCVVTAHPHSESLTQALAAAFCRGLEQAGHRPEPVDLYAQDFDPVVQAQEYLDWREARIPPAIQRYQALLQDSQGLALVYPVWWAAPPAILQGWLQRTFTQGFAFALGAQGPQGLLRHKVQLIANASSAGPDSEALYIEPLRGVLRFCGVQDIQWLLNTGVTPGMGPEAGAALLQQAQQAGRVF